MLDASAVAKRDGLRVTGRQPKALQVLFVTDAFENGVAAGDFRCQSLVQPEHHLLSVLGQRQRIGGAQAALVGVDTDVDRVADDGVFGTMGRVCTGQGDQ